MIGYLVKRARQIQRQAALDNLDSFLTEQRDRIHRELHKESDIAIEVSYPREDFVLLEHRR